MTRFYCYLNIKRMDKEDDLRKRKMKDIDFKRTVSGKSDAKDFLADLSWKEVMMSGNYHIETIRHD